MNYSRQSRWPRVYHPLYSPIPFTPLRYLVDGGRARYVTLAWLMLSLVAIPAGLITRYFELTGMSVNLVGETLHLTVYLPMLICLPVALWWGFWWAAIPAYLSTFFVALAGEMAWPWVLLFSFSNPLGLGTMLMVYRVAPVRVDLRDMPSILAFLGLTLIGALAGSAGSFIWAHTNRVGLNDFFPVWQGWWLGGFLQAVVICGPSVYLLSPVVLRWLHDLRVDNWQVTMRKRWLLGAVLAVLVTLIGFVLLARAFGLSRAAELMPLLAPPLKQDLQNAIDSLSYSHWIMVMAIAFAGYFAYQAVIHWTEVLRRANSELEGKNKDLVALSVTDPLTGIFNRRQLFELLQGEFAKARRELLPLVVLMVDVDHFKRINDRFGHQFGDQALLGVVERMQEVLRPYDVIGRYGGEEFMLILPGARAERAERIVERLLSAIAEPLPVEQRVLRVTVSVGVAALDDDDASPEALVKRADKALYAAKAGGRNRMEIAESPTAGS